MKLLLLSGMLLMSLSAVAQNHPSRKGTFYGEWGYNRSVYANSAIQFVGPGYDFTLSDVVAKDAPTPLSEFNKYVNPALFSIPQFNLHVGYFVQDNLSLSVGWDHMKYVMVNDQSSNIDGSIHVGSQYDGDYDNQDFKIAQNFLRFEHTDGLNYLNTEVRRSDMVLSNKFLQVNINEGIGAGVLYPRTNTTLLNNPRYDEFHVAGFGVAAVGSVQLSFFKHFFIQSEIKAGYINMPDIRTTMHESDKASQHFEFFQYNILFGGQFKLYGQ
jgi:hypothetical protein